MNLFGGLRKLLGIGDQKVDKQIAEDNRRNTLVNKDAAFFDANASEANPISKPMLTPIASYMGQPQPKSSNVIEYKPFTGVPNSAFYDELERQKNIEKMNAPQFQQPLMRTPSFEEVLKRTRF